MKNFFLIVLFGIASLLPADNLGVITYVQNSSLLIRDGKTLTAGFGLPIEIFDLVQTGRTGLLEMRIMSPEASGGGIGGILRIKPKTSFSLEKNEKIRLDIFTGSFGLDVKALGEEPEWEIHAENIRLRASTANFDLTATPEGRVLVTCESGRVVCENDTGIILFAEPGVAVENISGGAYRNISVLPADLENFRKSWTLKGTEDAVNEAASVVPDLIAHYIELKEKFDLAYHALLVKRNTLDTWFREDARGALGSETALLREKKNTGRAAFPPPRGSCSSGKNVLPPCGPRRVRRLRE